MTDEPCSPLTLTDAFEPIEGPNLRLRLVRQDDAAYVHGLRTNTAFNAHLSAVSGGEEGQRDWIARYKHREAELKELYYIIERCDTGQPCGTVRLYDIRADAFTWGSWILDEGKPPKAALESAVLVYDVGFGILLKSQAVFDVRRGNERTIAFHRRFGATQTGIDEMNVYFSYPRSRFNDDRTGYLAVLEGDREA